MDNILKDNFLDENILNKCMPIAFNEKANGNIVEGNAMGKAKGYILIPDGWTLEGDNADIALEKIETENWGTISIMTLEKNDVGTYHFVNEDDEFVDFAPNSIVPQTIAEFSPECKSPYIKEPLYLEGSVKFIKRQEGKEDKEVRMAMIMFRRVDSAKWVDDAPLGYIFARALTMDDDFVCPVKLLNLGVSATELIEIVDNDDKQITFKIHWPYGTVEVRGCEKNKNTFIVDKASLGSNRSLSCLFTPKGTKRTFAVKITMPMSGFCITYGEEVVEQGEITVPYYQLEHYGYEFPGGSNDDRLAIVLENNNTSLQYIRTHNDTLAVRDTNEINIKLGEVPSSGTLTELLMGKQYIGKVLEQTAGNWNKTRLYLMIKHKDERWHVLLANYPYRLEYEDGEWTVMSKAYKKPITTHLPLMAIDMDMANINTEGVALIQNEEGHYSLPAEADDWDNVLIYCKDKGVVYPKTFEIREGRKRNIIDILEDGSFMNAAWRNVISAFDIIEERNWPADCIPCIDMLSDHPSLLCKFAFHEFMLAQANNDLEQRKERLFKLQADLAFQWFWLKEEDKSHNALEHLLDIDNTEFDKYFELWIESMFGAGADIPTDSKSVMMQQALLFNQFESFLSELETMSKNDSTSATPDVLEIRRNSRRISKIRTLLSNHFDGNISLWNIEHDTRKELLHIYRNFNSEF